MVWIWLGVVISLSLTEYLSRNFTAICFVISGIISCILTKFTSNYTIQVGVFLIIGILLIIFGRPFLLKYAERVKKVKLFNVKNVNNNKRKEKNNKN